MSNNSQSTFVQKPVPADVWAMFICSLQKMFRVVPMHFNTTFSSWCAVCRDSWFRACLLAGNLHLLCNIYKSLIDAERTEVYTCPHNLNSTEVQLTGPSRPTHSSTEAWFTRCLSMRRKCGGPSIMLDPRVFSLTKRHMFQEYVLNRSPKSC